MSEAQPPLSNPVPPRRGDLTRERLLDAAESWVAEAGFGAPTHRGIGERAHVHTALVNYHFGSKEVLLEDMVERRAPMLIERWRAALQAVHGGDAGPRDVLDAYWQPFRAMHDEPQPWRRYLCVVAHLFHDRGRAASRERYFGEVERDFEQALREAVPRLGEDDVRPAFRYARTLLDESLYHRCRAPSAMASPPGFGPDDVPRLILFIAGGIEWLPLAGATNDEDAQLRAAAD